ncbi:MAG: arylsulfatase [Bryobacteraceae bacterium]
MITRRSFVGSAAGAAANLAAQANKPNILFILADDLGYGDLGCYGQKRVKTPNIDRLAAEGIRFTDAYSGSTVCAPSRCALMTGQHSGHGRIRGNKKPEPGLEPGALTVARLLKQAGYRTAMFGKWGLGGAGTTGLPNQQGFDEWFGYLDQQHAHTYYPDHLWQNEREFFLPGNFGVKKKQYAPDLFTARALGFLDKQEKGKPFFLYLPFTSPHANNEMGTESGNGMEVPEDAPYSGESWPQVEKNFAAIVTRLDRDIGRILAKLASQGLDKDTLVIFTSDNGPHREGGHDPDFFDSNGPLRGIKRDLYEGGIRVPAMARWPGVIKAGQVSGVPWAFWDILPTAAEIAGVAAPRGLDGVSLLPVLRGAKPSPREYLYWEFHERGFTQAVRIGDWKGVRRLSRSNPVEVYNLKEDIEEQKDVAAQHPDVARKMAAIMASARTDSAVFPVQDARH